MVTFDGAKSEVYSAFLVAEEGTHSTLLALAEVIERPGVLCALCADRAARYFTTPRAGGGVSRERPTRVERALQQLGIEHIAAYSPEARGDSERLLRALQDRLPNELRLAAIATLEAANSSLPEHYIAEHNAAFAVLAEQPGSAFVPDRLNR